MTANLATEATPGVGGGPEALRHRPLHRIVVGVDATPSAAAALDWAASLLDPGGRVVAVHAVPTTAELMMDSTPFGEAGWRRHLRHRVATEWCAGLSARAVPFDVHVVERGVAAAILSVAEEVDADLIVVGARRHHGHVIRHQATLATHLDHRAAVPVLCVPFDPSSR